MIIITSKKCAVFNGKYALFVMIYFPSGRKDSIYIYNAICNIKSGLCKDI